MCVTELKGQMSVEDFFNAPDKNIYPRPAWVKVSKGHKWCPYCNRVQEFLKDHGLGVKRCSKCGITEKDFFVKKYNNSWKW